MMAPRWQTVLLLAGAAALNYADRTSLSTVYPLLQADLKLSDIELASIGTLFLWSYAAASLPAGFIADRMPRNRVIAYSLLAWSLVTLLTGLVRNTGELLATRVALGLAECFYLPAAVALIADHHPPSSRARATSFHLCGLYAGLIGGGTLAGYLGETHGWRIGLLLLGGVGVVFAAICYRALPEAPRSNPAPAAASQQLLQLLGHRAFLLLAIQAMLIAVGTWMFFNWMPLYFKETFGLSLAVAGFSGTAVLQVASIAGALIGGNLSDRIARVSPRGRFTMMAGCYLLCAPCLLVFLSGGGMAIISMGVILFSFLRLVATANETAALCDLVSGENRATAQSLMNTLNTLGGGVGVFLAGYLKQDWGLSGVFAGVGLLVVLAAALTWLARQGVSGSVINCDSEANLRWLK